MEQKARAGKEETLRNNLEYTLFSWSKQAGLNPINVERTDGVYVYDYDGKRFIDFSSQLMNVNLGHNHPRVKEAIRRQLDEVAYVFPGMITAARGSLGKKLAEIAPGSLKKTFFTNGGADAVENAIKLARLYTGRHKIITAYRSYHGATYGAVSAGGDPRRLQVDREAMPSVVHIENPYCYRCPWGQTLDACGYQCVSHLERVVAFEGPENVAAILLEGESGSSGCIKYPPEYWKRVRALADRHDILVISDEVMSGFGRCGQWFAIQNAGVEPDMIVMAKGVTAGYVPLGGVIVSESIARSFDDRPLPLGLTYSAHALACATGNACIAVYEDEGLITAARDKGAYVEGEIAKLAERHPSIGDFRNTGLLGCIELVKDRATKEPMAPFNAGPDQMGVMNAVAAKLRELGMFTFVRWNWIFVAPPLTITRDEIDEGLQIISAALSVADEACH